MGEDLPETINEVALDPDLSDAHGIPAPLVRYRLSENSLRMLEFGVARAAEALQAAGATAGPRARTRCDRPAGTCWAPAAWATIPMRSVVDRWGRAHDVAEPVHRRRQPVRDQRGGQSDHDDPGAGAAHGRLHQAHARGAHEPRAGPARSPGRKPRRRSPPARRRSSCAARTRRRPAGPAPSVLNRIVPARTDLPGAGDLDVGASIEHTLSTAIRLRRLFLDGLLQIDVTAQRQAGRRFR